MQNREDLATEKPEKLMQTNLPNLREKADSIHEKILLDTLAEGTSNEAGWWVLGSSLLTLSSKIRKLGYRHP